MVVVHVEVVVVLVEVVVVLVEVAVDVVEEDVEEVVAVDREISVVMWFHETTLFIFWLTINFIYIKL